VSWDLICVGGGLGGAALGKALAEQGKRVLIVERERHFRDRVRGEYLESWGLLEARALGLEPALTAARAQPSPKLEIWIGPMRANQRVFETETDPVPAPRCVSHPAFQEAVLAAAAAAGAEVRRGAVATEITPGKTPSVRIRGERGEVTTEDAQLVAGADGRDSKIRRWLGFEEIQDPKRLCLAGVLLSGYTGPDDTSALFWNFAEGEEALLFPQGHHLLRAYLGYRSDTGVSRFSGKERVPDMLAAFRRAGVPEEWIAQVVPAGPLAGFEGADSRVVHPVREGVALIGDAAACSDPVWGCGMSLTLRDVRVLRDALRAHPDRETALHAYAEEHDRYYERLRMIEDISTEVFYGSGPEGDARRGRVFSMLPQQPDRIPDIAAYGPDQPVARSRAYYLGED
jgi:2-polyprenyl-6-methoxyphenol hydroxylase-like FAD-dependent oxidoreductase